MGFTIPMISIILVNRTTYGYIDESSTISCSKFNDSVRTIYNTHLRDLHDFVTLAVINALLGPKYLEVSDISPFLNANKRLICSHYRVKIHALRAGLLIKITAGHAHLLLSTLKMQIYSTYDKNFLWVEYRYVNSVAANTRTLYLRTCKKRGDEVSLIWVACNAALFKLHELPIQDFFLQFTYTI